MKRFSKAALRRDWAAIEVPARPFAQPLSMSALATPPRGRRAIQWAVGGGLAVTLAVALVLVPQLVQSPNPTLSAPSSPSQSRTITLPLVTSLTTPELVAASVGEATLTYTDSVTENGATVHRYVDARGVRYSFNAHSGRLASLVFDDQNATHQTVNDRQRADFCRAMLNELVTNADKYQPVDDAANELIDEYYNVTFAVPAGDYTTDCRVRFIFRSMEVLSRIDILSDGRLAAMTDSQRQALADQFPTRDALDALARDAMNTVDVHKLCDGLDGFDTNNGLTPVFTSADAMLQSNGTNGYELAVALRFSVYGDPSKDGASATLPYTLAVGESALQPDGSGATDVRRARKVMLPTQRDARKADEVAGSMTEVEVVLYDSTEPNPYTGFVYESFTDRKGLTLTIERPSGDVVNLCYISMGQATGKATPEQNRAYTLAYFQALRGKTDTSHYTQPDAEAYAGENACLFQVDYDPLANVDSLASEFDTDGLLRSINLPTSDSAFFMTREQVETLLEGMPTDEQVAEAVKTVLVNDYQWTDAELAALGDEPPRIYKTTTGYAVMVHIAPPSRDTTYELWFDSATRPLTPYQVNVYDTRGFKGD